MKKIFYLVQFFFVGILLYPDNNALKSFLEFSFDSKNIRKETHTIGGRKMLFVYENKIASLAFSKAIIMYQTDNDIFQPILYISGNKIIDKNGEIIFEGIIRTQMFYGWTISVTEKNNAFSLDLYTNNGTNVTDGPRLTWDSINNTFIYRGVDKREW